MGRDVGPFKNRAGGRTHALPALARLAWMIEMLHRGGFTRAQAQERFDVCLRTFRRDLATLRDAGFYLSAPESGATDRRFRLVCFRSESEAA